MPANGCGVRRSLNQFALVVGPAVQLLWGSSHVAPGRLFDTLHVSHPRFCWDTKGSPAAHRSKRARHLLIDSRCRWSERRWWTSIPTTYVVLCFCIKSLELKIFCTTTPSNAWELSWLGVHAHGSATKGNQRIKFSPPRSSVPKKGAQTRGGKEKWTSRQVSLRALSVRTAVAWGEVFKT